MDRANSRFDWDDGNREKCQSHGMSIAAIESVFAGPFRVAPDLAHSSAEDRFIAVGKADDGRPGFVAFTYRDRGGQTLIRSVSARYMHQREVRRYEDSAKDDDRR